MKQIQNLPIWYQGSIINATLINLYVISDNLTDTALFYFGLYDGTIELIGDKLSQGNLSMTGQDYIDYSRNTDSNTFAYIWATNLLGLTLI
jgi:hypothetical protein